MRERDLFYYVYENSERDYLEITNLIVEIAGFSNMTDEQELYIKDLYFRILFEIAFLDKANYANEEIIKQFKGLFDEEKMNNLRTKFAIVIDRIKEKLNQVENDTRL